MSSTPSSNHVIFKNSIFMTIRMLFVLLISLYTTRIILNVLGVEDYGVYNVVCGFVSMFGFLNSSMTSATQRFYNFELGQNGEGGIRAVFNTAVIIHLILAALILCLAEVFGLWYVENKLVIPANRMIPAIWIFHFSLIDSFYCIYVILH